MRSFLDASGLRFKQLVFIDDKLRNVQNVDAVFQSGNLRHVEFRYGAADSRVHAFDSDIADFEWNHFLRCNEFISDEAAVQYMGIPGPEGIPCRAEMISKGKT